MILIDLLCLVGLVYGFYKGFSDGLWVSIASFISLLVGLIGAIKFSTIVKDFLGWDTKMLPLIAFILTFLLVIVLVHLLAKTLTQLTKAVFLGGLNRLFGGVFQLLKSLLIACILMTLFLKVNYNNFMAAPETLDKSYLYAVNKSVSKHVLPRVFALFDTLFEQSMDEITK
ncbi:CvpA family protein [Flavobacterium sp. JP2137]|uniref:CvpA family protein n=1 Tax=Flavobacterium sp. JP2137 TaxID=3414510 RepID=UPI003D2FA165